MSEKIAYMAHPIDFSNPDGQSASVAEDLAIRLANIGMSVFRPNRAYEISVGSYAVGEPVGCIQAMNARILAGCDALAVVWLGREFSVGTAFELLMGVQQRKRIVMVTDLQASFALAWLAQSAGEGMFGMFKEDEIEEAAQWLIRE